MILIIFIFAWSADNVCDCLFQRHPKMDLNKNDLLRLLSYLEGELQARDISIAALKVHKTTNFIITTLISIIDVSEKVRYLTCMSNVNPQIWPKLSLSLTQQ